MLPSLTKEKSMRNISDSSTPKAIDRGEKGFTIVELIVAMVIFMIVTGAIWGLLRVGQLSRTSVNLQVQLERNVRVGLNLLGRDTLNAGFGYPLGPPPSVFLRDKQISTRLGLPPDTDPNPDAIPPIIAGNNITLNTFNETPGVRTDQVTFLFKDSTFNPVPAADPDNAVSRSVPVNRPDPANGEVVLPAGVPNTICRVNDIYLLTGGNGSSTLAVARSLPGANRVRFNNGDILGFNQTGGAAWTSITPLNGGAALLRVQMVSYFVTPEGILMRREFANAPGVLPFVDEPLVYGVEDFQIRYLMDNGVLTDNPSAGVDLIAGTPDDVQANLANVRQIRFTVSVRSTELDQTNRPYRVNMTSTFSTRNLGYSDGN